MLSSTSVQEGSEHLVSEDSKLWTVPQFSFRSIISLPEEEEEEEEEEASGCPCSDVWRRRIGVEEEEEDFIHSNQ